jgi:arylsulfatase A-like enzyme
MKDEGLQKRAREMGTELLHTYFAKNGYKTMAVGKICHHHVPEGSVDASGGRGSFHGGTGKLMKNWPQKGTSTDWAMAPERDEELPDHHAAEWAVKQLQANHDKPFLLMVGFLRPHVPWYVPKKWFDLHDKGKLTLPPYREDDLDDVPEMAREISILTQMPRTEWAIENNQWRNIVQAYLACTSFSDHQVGKVLDTLENSSYKDNTIIVLWSDHGYHMGEKNTFQKQSLWERSSHVPLVIAGPNVKGGRRCNRIVSLVDLYPTLLEMCHLPTNRKNEGRSLVPLLDDPGKEWPYPAIIGWKKNSFAVQNERYRYILYEDGSEELYDHEHDLNEWTNLAVKPEMGAVKSEMAEHLKKAGIVR